MKTYFDHEKLNVYQDSLRLATWAAELLEKVPKVFSVHSQLDRAATPIPLNIAGGNGKYTSADRCRYFDVSRGSALESAACLDVLVAKRLLTIEQVTPGKELLHNVVCMLVD
jgi:four helix bundle protein